jgi:DNA-binding GntR family transcriptional regulator
MGVTIPLLTERAYERLRRDIINCTLMPGSEVSESALATDYKLDKAHVRVALTQLTHEGLVSPIPRRGHRVTPITLKDIQDVFELRLMLEPVAARMAAGKVKTQRLKPYNDACREGYARKDAKSITRFLDANKAFRMEIAHATGNAKLAAAIDHLLDEITRLLHLGLSLREGSLDAITDYTTLIRALARGDGEAAERICREQIEASRSMILAAVLGNRSAISLAIAADDA